MVYSLNIPLRSIGPLSRCSRRDMEISPPPTPWNNGWRRYALLLVLASSVCSVLEHSVFKHSFFLDEPVWTSDSVIAGDQLHSILHLHRYSWERDALWCAMRYFNGKCSSECQDALRGLLWKMITKSSFTLLIIAIIIFLFLSCFFSSRSRHSLFLQSPVCIYGHLLYFWSP